MEYVEEMCERQHASWFATASMLRSAKKDERGGGDRTKNEYIQITFSALKTCTKGDFIDNCFSMKIGALC